MPSDPVTPEEREARAERAHRNERAMNRKCRLLHRWRGDFLRVQCTRCGKVKYLR